MAQIEQAELLVSSLYDVETRRPKSDAITHKEPSNFAFDDLRLYVAQRPLISGKYPEINGVVFEVQIKTVLQHAWSVATHDLIYKSDTVSWPRERIAFQVKAMLEHAEIAIAEAGRLANAPAVAKMDIKTSEILKLIEYINEVWSPDRLPKDIKRLAQTIIELLKSCDLKADNFQDLINAEKLRIGLLPSDLSPYALTLQAIAQSKTIKFEEKFKRRNIRTKIVVHNGMELPAWVTAGHERILKID
jgi:hypothetical protein